MSGPAPAVDRDFLNRYRRGFFNGGGGLFGGDRLVTLGRDFRAEHAIDQSIFLRLPGIQVEVDALGIADDLAQRLAGSVRHDAVDLALHLFEPVEVLRGSGRRLPPCPLGGLVNHDPRMRVGHAAPRTRRLQNHGSHRVGHPLDHDGDLDPHAYEVLEHIVNREAVGDVAPCTVDVQRDGFPTVVGQLAQPLDDHAGVVPLDVTDEVDVAKSLGLLLFEQIPDSVDDLLEQTCVQIAHAAASVTCCVPYLYALRSSAFRMLRATRNRDDEFLGGEDIREADDFHVHEPRVLAGAHHLRFFQIG